MNHNFAYPCNRILRKHEINVFLFLFIYFMIFMAQLIIMSFAKKVLEESRCRGLLLKLEKKCKYGTKIEYPNVTTKDIGLLRDMFSFYSFPALSKKFLQMLKTFTSPL
jgi:hypothetical protein